MSLAETTLSKYMPSPSSSHQQHHNPSQQQTGQRQGTDSHMYPFWLDDPNTISDYPVGFRGCFGCSQQDHWQFKEYCPLHQDKDAQCRFWRNLWIHKPQTKKRPSSTPTNPPQAPSAIPSSSHHPRFTPAPHATTLPSAFPINQLSSHQTPQSPPHGLGCGQAATQPAWLAPPSNPPASALKRSHPSSSNAQPPQRQHTVSFTPSSSSSSQPSTQANSPIDREDPVPHHSCIFITKAQVFSLQSANQLHPMPLDIDNGLPSISLRLGQCNTLTPNATQAIFSAHVDTCASMNTGNLDTHQWVMSMHPEIVAEYIEYSESMALKRLLCTSSLYKIYEVSLVNQSHFMLHFLAYYF